MKNLTALQKGLLAWTIVFLGSAEAIKFLTLSGRLAKLVGLVELLLAMITGVAVGLSTSLKRIPAAARRS